MLARTPSVKRKRRTYGKRKRRYGSRRLVVSDKIQTTMVPTRYISPSNARGPLPNKLRATLILNTSGNIATGINTNTGNLVISANNPYEPRSGVAIQPRGFDQMMNLYDHFVVIGSKLEMWFNTTEPTLAAQVGVVVRDTISPEATQKAYMENRLVKTAIVDSATGGTFMSIQVNPNKFLGRSKPLADPQLKGSSASSPTEQCFYHIFASNHNPSSGDSFTVTVNARVIYDVVLIEPRQVSAS